MAEFEGIRLAMAMLHGRLKAARQNEDGYSTEAVVVTALLVLLAIGALGLIAAKVMDTASNLKTS